MKEKSLMSFYYKIMPFIEEKIKLVTIDVTLKEARFKEGGLMKGCIYEGLRCNKSALFFVKETE